MTEANTTGGFNIKKICLHVPGIRIYLKVHCTLLEEKRPILVGHSDET